MATPWVDLHLYCDGDDLNTIGMKDYANPDDIPFSVLGGGTSTCAKTTEVSTQMKNKIMEHNKRGVSRNQVEVTTKVRLFLSL